MKASEVFDLPVSAGSANYNGDDMFGADGNGIWHATFCSQEQAQVAANCINHADALADALEWMIKSNWGVASEKRVSQVIAGAALAAYRGAK